MCENTVEQYVERGFEVKTYQSRCGTTGWHGQRLECDQCEQTSPPQSWGDKPYGEIYGYDDY